MKRFFTLLLCLIFAIGTGYAQEREINAEGKYKGMIRIKFKQQEDKKVDALNQILLESKEIKLKEKPEFVKTNIKNIDDQNEKFKAFKMKRVYRYAGKHEARHRKFGLHLWYELEFSSNTPVKQLVASYQNVAEVSIAEAVHAIKHVAEGNGKEIVPTALPSGTNDPKFSDQWHYENTGQNDGTPGSDISLLEAWQIETGNSNVIVAVEDGGVDFDHVDLAANMWVNPGEIAGNGIDDDNNGYVDDIYGYNFGDDTGEIYVGDHGTHVAGTIAAVNNNGVGVSGVAGGSGSGDGVRIMSCNVFAASTGGFAEAFTYAADNGAVISQNSWSYRYPYYYDQAVLDGIDYFIANAGGPDAPMNGGLVIFSAGNDNSQSRYYPAYYDKVLSVAATNKNDVRSYYSNYGDWVDIAAPGGELETTNEDPTAIHSTYPNDQYGVMQGTSMACPHVSGVAALIVSKYAGNITPSEVWSKLVDNTDDIDALQSATHAGKLGSGRLNAYKALTDDNLPSVPSGLTANNVTQTSFTIEWNAVSGATSYDLQVREQGGSWQSINTTATTHDYTGATAGTTYEFQVRANNDAGSSGYSAIASVTTEAAPTAPDTPANLAASAITYNSMTISWDAATDADDYDLQVRPQGGTWTTINQVGTSYDYTSLTAETTYEFQVRANNDVGSSDYSAIVSATTLEAPTAPDTPTNLAASAITYSSMTISWDAMADTDDYDLQVRPQGGSWTTINQTGTSYNYSGLTGETTYEFQVRANNDIGSSAYSAIASATTLEAPTAPATPTNLAASAITYNSMTISWDATAETDDYDLQVRPQGGSWTTINQVGTSYNYTGLTGETTYEFQVRANNEIGSSAYSAIASATTLEAPTAPGIPQNVVASNITYNSFTISWDALTDADDYDLEIRVSGGSWTSFNTTATSYDYSSADASTDYEFRVRGNNEVGAGEFSPIGTLSTDPIPVPGTPTGLSASNVTSSSFTLSWSSVQFADNYDVQIREDGGAWEAYSTSSTSFDYTSALAETTYEFQVRATNSTGDSDYTAIQSVTTLGESPTPDYCESYGKSTRYEYIDLVELADMSNPSGDDGGYGDYTGLIANVAPGNSYTLNFSLAYKRRTYTANWKIYIDFNRDGNFANNEIVASGYTVSSGISSANVNVPSDAALGHTRMRVILKHRRAAANGCQVFSQGEVEDYTVNISNSAPAYVAKTAAFGLPLSDTPPVEELKLYPNPAKDFVNLFIQGNIQSRVRISSITGKTIKVVTLDLENNTLDVSDLPSGMYFISIEDGEEVVTKKLLKL
ncbi:fibronectin type III domain-containing protein [Marinifilum caeruleilacunae]|uniref:T9SS type A sorting domain-containing protein n=1 Tax=Marinifilum caeruleilacunae TaxID=2499076 RepID=A0ABX1WT29_9BACT|nr:fibronectin type III domain-containing protein [Marinifilum caeruleilacunae]NOU59246.1 T9SS type A sorting domain-containing protein [Marinifilum caeruleilacunae]